MPPHVMYVSKVPHRRCSYLDPCTRPALCTSTRADAKLQAVQGRKTPFSSLVTHLSLARSQSLARGALSLSHTHACPFACPLASSRAVFALSFVLPCSLVPFLNAYHLGRSPGLVPLPVSYLAIYQVGRLLESGPSTLTSLPSLLLHHVFFFPFPFSSGHFLSCEANWYPNGSCVFLTLFLSSVYPPLRDPRPEFGVSLPVVSFF